MVLVLVSSLTDAGAQPAAPVIAYPSSTYDTNIKVNPTIFWSAYDRTGGGFESDVQRNFQIQIATSSGFAADTIVYTTDSGTGDPPDCAVPARPRCLGAGMAHLVASEGAYPGLFQGVLAGGASLAEGMTYHLRMRAQSRQDGAWSPFSATVSFTTVSYDGDEYFVSTTGDDSGECRGTGSAACASLAGALAKVSSGDTITIQPGQYIVPASNSGASTAINYFDAPDRITIRGESPTDRPVFKPNTNANMSDPAWILMNNGDDIVYRDLIFRGSDGCCTTFKDGANSQIFTFSLSQSSDPVSDRVSFINVDFLKNVFVVVDDNASASAPAVATLFWHVTRTNEPVPTTLQSGVDRTLNGMNINNSRFLTFKDVTFDGGETGLFTSADPSNPTEHVLMEETAVHRYVVHPMRPAGLNINWTVRRHVQGDGPEGFHFGGVVSSIRNFVVENSSFIRPLQLCDNGGNGSISYLVATNNLFADPLEFGDARGMFHVDQVVNGVRTCDSASVCGGASCNILDGSERVLVAYNDFYKSSTSASIVNWDGTNFTRCNGAEDYDAWNVLPFVEDSLIAAGACADNGNDSVDPLYIQPLDNEPALGRVDLRLQTGSPAIDAGDPDTFVPQDGGGTRVDIGAFETPIAPVVTLIDPQDMAQCAPDGTSDLVFEIEDLQDDIDTASIVVTVMVNGVVVASGFSVTGIGSQVTVDVSITGGVSNPSVATVEVLVGDTAAAPNITSALFTFKPKPPAPSGVIVG